jgi:hypothetical protein
MNAQQIPDDVICRFGEGIMIEMLFGALGGVGLFIALEYWLVGRCQQILRSIARVCNISRLYNCH